MEKSSLCNMTVLVVDDYMINVELLKIFIKETGASALSASNGMECLDIVKNQKVDMVLMDLNMPVMNGIEATKVLRSLPQHKDLVIIGVIGYEDKDEIEFCRQAGMNDAVPKFTFSPQKLVEFGNTYFGEKCKVDQDDIHMDASKDSSAVKIDENDIAIMDFNKALREFESDTLLLLNLLKDFDSIVKEQLEVIKDAYEKDDFKRIEIEAHGIKGGALNICAQLLADAARELEYACRSQMTKMEISEKYTDLKKQAIVFSIFVTKKI